MTAAKAPASPMPAFSLEFRASERPNAPKLTITGSNAAELQDRVDTALANSLFALAGKAREQMTASYVLGNKLGAEPVDAPKVSIAEASQTEAAAQALDARKEAAKAADEATAAPWGTPAGEAAVWPPKPDPTPAAAPAAQATPAASAGGASGGWPPAPAWAS